MILAAGMVSASSKWRRTSPLFHHRWEAAVFAMMFAAGRAGATGNSDRFRHAIERIDPAAYLEDSYYGRWLRGLETLFVEAGLLTGKRSTRRRSTWARQ